MACARTSIVQRRAGDGQKLLLEFELLHHPLDASCYPDPGVNPGEPGGGPIDAELDIRRVLPEA